VATSVDAVNRRFAALLRGFAVLGFAVLAGACSTPVYTSSSAVRDLERQSGLTPTQAQCVVNAIRRHFETEIEAKQKTNKLSALPADQLKLEVDGALAALRTPTGSEEDVARVAIARCAPGALR
jgi:hypothetical protein